MTNLYQTYKAARAERMAHYNVTAKDAVRTIRHKAKLAAFLAENGLSSYMACEEEIELSGYTITIKLESDENFSYEDIFPRKGGENSQGYFVSRMGRYDDKDQATKRYQNGEGLVIADDVADYSGTDWRLFELPESYIRQFYDGKQFSRANAYNNMIASAKHAIEQDIKSATADNYYLSVTVTDANDEEIYSESIGGINEDYAGEALLDSGFIEDAKEAIEVDMQSKARDIEATRPDMYQAQIWA